MRIYNPQNQFGQELVTKQLVSSNLEAITGYALSDSAVTPSKGTLQAQIDALKTGKLSYVILTKEQWEAKKTHLEESDVNTVYLVPETVVTGDNIYTEYLVYKTTDTPSTIKYEKIGEIGGDVSELVRRIETLEKAKVSDITSAGDQSAAITITHTADPTTATGTTWTITANKASTTAYGVVKLSTDGAAGEDTELVVTEAQLKAVKDELDGKIEDLTDGTTTAVGQVRTVSLTVGDAAGEAGTTGTFTIAPDGVSKVKILAVEDNTGEQWSYKLSTADADNGKVFQVWNEGDYAKMESGTAPTSLTVSYAVVELATASAS